MAEVIIGKQRNGPYRHRQAVLPEEPDALRNRPWALATISDLAARSAQRCRVFPRRGLPSGVHTDGFAGRS